MTTPNCNEAHQGNRYIALIDILGFRSLLNTTPLAEIVRKVEVLLEDSQRYLGSNRRTLGEVHFSDTILIWTPLVNGGVRLWYLDIELVFWWGQALVS